MDNKQHLPPTLLLTGFEPFGKWSTNPSWEVARALDNKQIGGLHIVSRQLPVDWQHAWPALRAAIEQMRPQWVLMLGQAARRPYISVESRACNACDNRPDNSGGSPGILHIDANGPDELPSTLPVEIIAARIISTGLPVELSLSAGEYLCNHTLYMALAWAKSLPDPPCIGFIHVPGLPGDDPVAPGMLLSDMERGVLAALEAIAEAIPAAANG